MSPPNETPPAGERGAFAKSDSTPNTPQFTQEVRPWDPPKLNRKVVTEQTCVLCKIREANWRSPTGHLACTQCRLSEIRNLLANVDDAIAQLRFELCEVGALYIESAS
jgi:hypothetical protein